MGRVRANTGFCSTRRLPLSAPELQVNLDVRCHLHAGDWEHSRARARIGEPWATVGWRCPRFWRSPAILCLYKDPFSATSNPCTGFAYHGLACAGHVRQGGRRKARVGRCACAPTPTSPPLLPPLLQSCSRKRRGESLATGAGEGAGGDPGPRSPSLGAGSGPSRF